MPSSKRGCWPVKLFVSIAFKLNLSIIRPNGEMRPGLYINKLGCKRCPLSLSTVNACVSRSYSSKLSQCRAKLEPNILSTCEPIGAFITEQTHAFIEHVNTLKWFSSLLFTSGSMSVFVLFLSLCVFQHIYPARLNAWQRTEMVSGRISNSWHHCQVTQWTCSENRSDHQGRNGAAQERTWTDSRRKRKRVWDCRSLLMCLNRTKYDRRKFTTTNKLAWCSNVISSRYLKNASVSFKNPSWTAFKYENLVGVYEWSWFNSSDVFEIHRYFE